MEIKNIFAALLLLSITQLQCTKYRLHLAEYKDGNTTPESIEVECLTPPTYGDYKRILNEQDRKAFTGFQNPDSLPATEIIFSLGDAGSIGLCEKIAER